MDLVPFRDTASYQTEPMGETVKSFNMAITVVYVPMSENLHHCKKYTFYDMEKVTRNYRYNVVLKCKRNKIVK